MENRLGEKLERAAITSSHRIIQATMRVFVL
jgi:hypothetical protein